MKKGIYVNSYNFFETIGNFLKFCSLSSVSPNFDKNKTKENNGFFQTAFLYELITESIEHQIVRQLGCLAVEEMKYKLVLNSCMLKVPGYLVPP